MPRKRGWAGARTAQDKVARQDDKARALNLARQGFSVRQIAAKLDCSSSHAQRLLVEGRTDIPVAERDALIKEIHERELGIILAHWPNRKDPDSAKVIQASDKILISMFGLEAPKALTVQADLAVADASPEVAARLVRDAFGSHAARTVTDEAQSDVDQNAGDVPEAPPES